jgi:probable HAF family extracellular repeat protein
MIRIGTLPGDSESQAQGINAVGQVVGQSFVSFGYSHAFLWEDGVMTALGTLPGSNFSDTAAINDASQIAGTARVNWPSPARAFLWQGGAMVDLGTFAGSTYSSTTGINGFGQVVGEATTEGGYDVGHLHAVLWRDGLMIDLNTAIPPDSGWVLFAARGINDAGQISGWGVHDGEIRGFLLSPSSF